jgi:AcrR family transcriptional regulator
MRRSSEQTREHVLATARELFYWRGIRATGVDAVAAAAGVAPTTLYRLFASKDELVAAYLEREAAGYRAWFDAAVAEPADDPRGRVLSLFDALAEQVRPEHCRGCPFQMGLAELPDPGLPGHEHAVAVKAWTRSRLADLAAALLGPGEAADVLADRLLLVLEGAYASVASLGADGPAARARALVEHLLPGRA